MVPIEYLNFQLQTKETPYTYFISRFINKKVNYTKYNFHKPKQDVTLIIRFQIKGR